VTGIPTQDAIENHSVAWVSVIAFSMTAMKCSAAFVHARRTDALEAGAAYEELLGTLIVVMPVVGVARDVSAAPSLGLALGYGVAGRSKAPRTSVQRRPRETHPKTRTTATGRKTGLRERPSRLSELAPGTFCMRWRARRPPHFERILQFSA
jgi:hypothetical protein